MKKLPKVFRYLAAAGLVAGATLGLAGCHKKVEEENPIIEKESGDKGTYILFEVNGHTVLVEGELAHTPEKDEIRVSPKCGGTSFYLTDYVILYQKPDEMFYDYEYGVDLTFTDNKLDEQEMGE